MEGEWWVEAGYRMAWKDPQGQLRQQDQAVSAVPIGGSLQAYLRSALSSFHQTTIPAALKIKKIPWLMVTSSHQQNDTLYSSTF